MTTRSVRVLLLWPGTDGAAAGNFGVPQLVLIATYLREKTGAIVSVRDLVCEQAFGPVELPKLLAGDDGRGYDIIAIGVYSSFDFLKCQAIAEVARALYPNAVIVAGGYHASARPNEIVYDGSPFDVCIVGEGEKPMVRIVESVAGGAPLRATIFDSDAIEHLDELPPSDWSYLQRYRSVARKINSQVQVYLSRGCPFDCAFCMERAKREVSWRALSVERAMEELRSLHRFLDLRTWTVYLADALFGMKVSWRRKFLEQLAREKSNIPVDKFWLLIRVDLVEDEDLQLFQQANCGLGFGLESGDPQLLAIIRKAGRLEDYLQRMQHVSARARELDLPWGANVIIGHPGETEDTLRRSAAYLRDLFLDPRGVTGFLSVDPFRLYPGSPIDAERSQWEGRYGTVFHRPSWWHDGDQEFLAEWVDPSRELTYLRRAQLQHELLSPVLRSIEKNFVYQGPAREYFLRAVQEQAQLTSNRYRMHFFDRYFAWNRYLGRHTRAEKERANDPGLKEVARALRAQGVREAMERVGSAFTPPEGLLEALHEVPRERFVPLDELAGSLRDEAIALDRSGKATVSAMHAYVLSFSLLHVKKGDRVLDLGAGTGYGSALLSEIVGAEGSVVGVELDPRLASKAQNNLAERTNVTFFAGDALDPKVWGAAPTSFTKITLGFSLEALPEEWSRVLSPETIVIAPIGPASGNQMLTRATLMEDRTWLYESITPVRYVPVRRTEELPADPPADARAKKRAEEPRKLPVVV